MNALVGVELPILEQLTTDQLAQRLAELTGEPPRSRHRGYLLRKVAWRIQAQAKGGLSDRAQQRARELADDAEVRVMPPRQQTTATPTCTTKTVSIHSDERLPLPGTIITRPYKGRNLQVMVLADGFEFQGNIFKTLSSVAKVVTGSHVNGFHFFRLGKPR